MVVLNHGNLFFMAMTMIITAKLEIEIGIKFHEGFESFDVCEIQGDDKKLLSENLTKRETVGFLLDNYPMKQVIEMCSTLVEDY